MYRIAKRRAGNYRLTATAYDVDGVKTNISGTVTITITDVDGTSVVTGTPTITDGELIHTFTYDKLAQLGVYHVIWTGTAGGEAWVWETDFELVGGFYFTIAELRAWDSRNLSDDTKYPDALVEAARARAEDRFERAANAAWVQRSVYEVKVGDGTENLYLDNFVEVTSVTAATIAGVALTPTELSALKVRRNGKVIRDALWDDGEEVTITYVHGFTEPIEPVKQAVMTLAREYLMPSVLPARATSQTIGDNTFRLTIAGRDGSTGIPEVDKVVEDFGYKSLVVG